MLEVPEASRAATDGNGNHLAITTSRPADEWRATGLLLGQMEQRHGAEPDAHEKHHSVQLHKLM